MSNPPTKQATQRMMNVDFAFVFRSTNEDEDDFIMDTLCEATVDHFAGTEIIRDSFRITFHTCFDELDHELPDLMKTRFFQTVKGFNGFRKVTFVVYLVHDINNPRNSTPEKELEEMRNNLEPHLGPSVTRSVTLDPPEKYQFVGETILELEFTPQRFHVESLRAGSVRLTMEAVRVEG